MLMKFFLTRYKIENSLTLNITGINVFKNIKADNPKRNINFPLPSWAI